MMEMVGAAQIQDRDLAKKKKKKKRGRNGGEDLNKGDEVKELPGLQGQQRQQQENKKSKKEKEKKGPNSLRNAIKNSNNKGEALTAAQRKANELWFRKANYGEILFWGY